MSTEKTKVKIDVMGPVWANWLAVYIRISTAWILERFACNYCMALLHRRIC